MKKILITLGIIPVLSLTSFAQRSDIERQYDEVSRELSLGIHNIEKSVESYAEEKNNKSVMLESMLVSDTELVKSLQNAQTDYNVKKDDENFNKLQDIQLKKDKSNAEILDALADSLLTDVEYAKKLSEECYLLALQYDKFDSLYSTMGSAAEMEDATAKVEEKKRQIANIAITIKGLMKDVPNDKNGRLGSTLTLVQNEFRNSMISNTGNVGVNSEFKKQSELLKDASAQFVNYAGVLELDRKKIALAILDNYRESVAGRVGGNVIVAPGVDPVSLFRQNRMDREAIMDQFTKNRELSRPIQSKTSATADYSDINALIEGIN